MGLKYKFLAVVMKPKVKYLETTNIYFWPKICDIYSIKKEENFHWKAGHFFFKYVILNKKQDWKFQSTARDNIVKIDNNGKKDKIENRTKVKLLTNG